MSIVDQIRNYCLLLDYFNEKAWLTDGDGAILFANKSALKDPSTEVLGHNIIDVLEIYEENNKCQLTLASTTMDQKQYFSKRMNLYLDLSNVNIPDCNKRTFLWKENQKNLNITFASDTFVNNKDVRDYYSINQKLKISEGKNRAILDALPDMLVILDRKGTYIDVRPPAHHKATFDANCIIGQTLHQLLPAMVADLTIGKISQVLDTGRMEIFRYTIPKKDAKKHYEARMVACSENEVLTIISDITKRWNEEEAIIESEERFRLLAENARDMIFRISLFPRKKVEFVSPVCEQILGYSPEDFYNDPELDYKIIHHEDRVKLDNGSIVKENDNNPIVLRWICKNDKILHIEQKWVPLFDKHGKLIALEGICRDITDRIEDHNEKVKLEAELYQAQKMQAIGQLAGGVAHDFNNLLTGIVGNIELALMDLDPLDQAVEYLDECKEAVKLATNLSLQMLAYSGKGHFHLQNLNLSETIKNIKMLPGSYTGGNIKIDLNLAEKMDNVMADHSQIQQVLMSLIHNASEAIGQKNGKISISTGEIECDSEYRAKLHLDGDIPDGKCCYIEVTDNGCGMDIETREQMFEPFFTTKFTGRGLGLSAVLGIVIGHNGGIAVDSKLGQGTSIRILLPAQKQTTCSPKIQNMQSVNTNKTILVVDDERLVRHVAKKTLLKCGHEVLLASDGKEAIEIFKSRGNDIDLVLLDLTMPNMNGEEAFYKLKDIDKEIPILLASGFSESVIRERFTTQSPSDFLQKPFTPTDLNNAIGKVFQ